MTEAAIGTNMMHDFLARRMMAGDKVDVHMLSGYHVVWSKEDGAYSIWKDGQRVGMANQGQLYSTLMQLNGKAREEARTHDLSWYMRFEMWLVEVPDDKFNRIIRWSYAVIFIGWMAFAVYMFL